MQDAGLSRMSLCQTRLFYAATPRDHVPDRRVLSVPEVRSSGTPGGSIGPEAYRRADGGL